jgi:hypothetical protein
MAFGEKRRAFQMLRAILGAVAGCVLAMCVIFGMELIGQQLFPLPAGTDPTDMAALKAAAAQMPPAALMFVVLGWIVGTAVGGWAANAIGGRVWPAYVVGGLIALASIGNGMMIPQPLWVTVAGVLGPAIAAFAVARLGGPRAPAAAA